MRTSNSVLTTITMSVLFFVFSVLGATPAMGQENSATTLAIATSNEPTPTKPKNTEASLTSKIKMVKPGRTTTTESAGMKRMMHTAGNAVGTVVEIGKNLFMGYGPLIKRDSANMEIGGAQATTLFAGDSKVAVIASHTRWSTTESAKIEFSEHLPQGAEVLVIAAGKNYADPVRYTAKVWDDKIVVLDTPLRYRDCDTFLGAAVFNKDGKLFGAVEWLMHEPKDGEQKKPKPDMEILALKLITADVIESALKAKTVKVKNSKQKFAPDEVIAIPGGNYEWFAAPNTTPEELAKLTEKANDNRAGWKKLLGKIFGKKQKDKTPPLTEP